MLAMTRRGFRLRGVGDRAFVFSRPSPLAPRAREGFSLIELIIALAILSVGLVGAMRVFPIGLRASARSEVRSRAAFAAQRTIESLKLLSWEALVEQETVEEDEDFEVRTRITSPDVELLDEPERIKAIEVRVRLLEEATPRELTVVTYVRRDTP